MRCVTTHLIVKLTVIATVRAPRPQHDVALGIAQEESAKPLAIAVPQFRAEKGASNRPAKYSTRHGRTREVDHDNQLRARPDEIAHGAIVPVADPGPPSDELADSCAELLEFEGCPVRLVIELVEFEQGSVELLGDRSRERRFPTSRRSVNREAWPVDRSESIGHRPSVGTSARRRQGAQWGYADLVGLRRQYRKQSRDVPAMVRAAVSAARPTCS